MGPDCRVLAVATPTRGRCARIFAAEAACPGTASTRALDWAPGCLPGRPPITAPVFRSSRVPGRADHSAKQSAAASRVVAPLTGLRQQIGPAYEPAPRRCLSRGEAPLLTGPLRTSVGAGHAARPEASNVSRDGVLLRCLHCSFGLGFALPGVAASPRGSSATEGPVEGVQALGLAHSAAIPAWPA